MAYTFYIDGTQLPITPGKLHLKINNQNKTVQMINYGEVNVLKAAGLTDISFSFLLPAYRYPFAQSYESQQSFLSKLEQLKNGLRPFSFTVYRDGGFSNSMNVTLEDYEWTEDAEQYGRDLMVDIKLKQWQDYGVKTITVKPAATPDVPATATVTQTRDSSAKIASTPDTYTVKQGDTLWGIAKAQLGNGSKWSELASLNKGVISNPNVIRPGQVIRLK